MILEPLRDRENTLSEFDRIIGLPFLFAFNLNDSLKELGSRVDRLNLLEKGKSDGLFSLFAKGS